MLSSGSRGTEVAHGSGFRCRERIMRRARSVLRRAGARQFLFKYCSTFDSTEAGNIGPVTEALMQALEIDFTIACPAFPGTGSTIFRGHLFVGDQLLSDSPMRDHPLTPMTDSNPVGVVQCATIDAGVDAIRDAFAGLRAEGVAVAIVDAVSDAQLYRTGRALDGFPLVTGGSGIAIGLPETYRRAGLLTPASGTDTVPAMSGSGLVLSGNCSTATRVQVDAFAPVMRHCGWIRCNLPPVARRLTGRSGGRDSTSGPDRCWSTPGTHPTGSQVG